MIYLNKVAFDVLNYMRSPAGQSQAISMPLLSATLDVPDDPIHGRQHYVSQGIEQLRHLQLIHDVPNRCWNCKRPPRVRRIVILYLTDLGKTADVEERTVNTQRNRRAIKFEKLGIYDQINNVQNDFYENISRLVAQTLDLIPKEHHSALLERLQDNCNVYSMDYERYLKQEGK